MPHCYNTFGLTQILYHIDRLYILNLYVSAFVSLVLSQQYVFLTLRLAIGYHNIMLRAFSGMHDAGQAPLMSMDEMTQELALVTLVDGMAATADLTGEDLYRKALRVKSTKTYEWLLCQGTVHHLLVCTLVNRALERVMYAFMRWQRDEYWLRTTDSPIILMSNPSTSPAMGAIQQIFALMTNEHCLEDGFHLQHLLEGVSSH